MRDLVLAAMLLGVCPGQGLAQALPEPAAPASQSSLNIPAHRLPPSSLSSEEQQRAYVRSLALPGDGRIVVPGEPKMIAMMRRYIEAQFQPTLAFVRSRYAVETRQETINGVEVIRVTPRNGVDRRNRKRILLNFHGGSFMVGWPSVALLDAIPVAALSGIEVVTVNYRKYPEAVHPAALEDLGAVYRQLLKDRPARNIGIFGGSAGGVLTLQAIPWLRAQGLPQPAAIAPLAAAFRTAVGDSAIWNFSGGFAPPGTRTVLPGGYLGDSDRRDLVPGVTAADFARYPPTLWVVGNRAPEFSGATMAHARLLKEGVASELYVIEGGWHQSYSTAPEAPESQDAMHYIARWFDRRLGR